MVSVVGSLQSSRLSGPLCKSIFTQIWLHEGVDFAIV